MRKRKRARLTGEEITFALIALARYRDDYGIIGGAPDDLQAAVEKVYAMAKFDGTTIKIPPYTVIV